MTKKTDAAEGANYVERTDAGTRTAMAQTIEASEQKFNAGITKIVAGANQMVDGVNDVYDAGRGYADARDLNQFEFRNWHRDAADWKADALHREKMNCAIKVYEAMKDTGRAKKLADCPKAVQIILKFAQPPDKDKPKLTNGEGGNSAGGGEEKNWWSKLTSVASDFESVMLKLQADGEHPIERMQPEELDKLVRATDPIVQVNLKAKETLKLNPVES